MFLACCLSSSTHTHTHTHTHKHTHTHTHRYQGLTIRLKAWKEELEKQQKARAQKPAYQWGVDNPTPVPPPLPPPAPDGTKAVLRWA